MIFVTGGAGFIGSNFILNWMKHNDEAVLNIDKLTYAGNLKNLESVQENNLYKFFKSDIGDTSQIEKLFKKYQPRAIINFAAESHVDRSISKPNEFIETNISATFNLLLSALNYWEKLEVKQKDNFRFIHISTDEVYGSLLNDEPAFTEENQYKPNSPYSATKASSDHLARSFFHTYGLPIITTNCSNNYGPYQFPEKLIPLSINNALTGKDIPIYGDGSQIRDWLYVKDHCSAINRVLNKGILGEVYNIGGNNEIKNLDVVTIVCEILDKISPSKSSQPYKNQISFVEDRKGHDKRYAINASKISSKLDWHPEETFQSGIEKTINWYLDNRNWMDSVISGEYSDWIKNQYGSI